MWRRAAHKRELQRQAHKALENVIVSLDGERGNGLGQTDPHQRESSLRPAARMAASANLNPKGARRKKRATSVKMHK